MAMAILVLAATTTPVLAGPRDACAAVQSDLESLTDGQRARGLLKQLSETDEDMHAAGCADEAVPFGPPPSPRCPALQYRATVLRRFLAAHDPASLPSDDGEIAGRRTMLRLRLSELGCTGYPTRQAASDGGQWQGNYRTLCVRRCDGYYFPVSWAATAAHFKRDEMACRSKYPPGEAELYVQANPRVEDDDGIVSLAGEAYSSQPFAFSFRHSFDRSCARLFGAGASDARDPPSTPQPGADAARVWSSEPVPTSSALSQEADRRVRIVGSSSYYAIPETETLSPESGAKVLP